MQTESNDITVTINKTTGALLVALGSFLNDGAAPAVNGAQVASAAAKPAAPKTAATAAPAPTAKAAPIDTGEAVPSRERVRELALQKSGAGHKDAIKAILSRYNVAKTADVPEEFLLAYYNELKAL